MQTQTHITILLVSHSMDDVAEYVDRIIVMNGGKIVYDDIPRRIFRRYRELEKMGLGAPQVTYILHTLKESGLPVDTDITTIQEAADSIMQAISSSRGNVC